MANFSLFASCFSLFYTTFAPAFGGKLNMGKSCTASSRGNPPGRERSKGTWL